MKQNIEEPPPCRSQEDLFSKRLIYAKPILLGIFPGKEKTIENIFERVNKNKLLLAEFSNSYIKDIREYNGFMTERTKRANYTLIHLFHNNCFSDLEIATTDFMSNYLKPILNIYYLENIAK